MMSVDFLKKAGFSDTFLERFFKNVNKSNGCWNWTACKGHFGYGVIGRGGHGNQMSASRASWIIHFGNIPEGKFVLHHCDNPSCVRPDHLFIGDPKTNFNDMLEKGRQNLLGKAKITAIQAKEIRQANSKFRKKLATQYGVDVTQICRIINRRRWNHSHAS